MNPPVVDNKKNKQPRSFLEKAFPVPKSLILSETAIDISDGNLRFFEFSESRGILKPKAFDSLPFPRLNLGTLSEKLRTEAISALKTWASKKKCDAARVVIHEGEAYVFKVTIPTLHHHEMRAAIEALLEENVPVKPDEAVFEFDVISKDHETQTSTVAVSVISKKSAATLIDIFKESGIEVTAIETESRALARCLFPKETKKVFAVISIAEHHSIVFIVENGAVVFSTAMEIGSVDLDQAIAKEFGITEPEARALKMEKAFMESDGDMKLFEAMAPIFSIIQDELGKMLIYWKAQGKKGKDVEHVSKIVLSGRDALIAGFARYIALNSKIPTKIGSVWTNVLVIEDEVPQILFRDSFEYGTVIGALL